jgi:hypothetical protein
VPNLKSGLVLAREMGIKCIHCEDSGWVSRVERPEAGITYDWEEDYILQLGGNYGRVVVERCPRGCLPGIEKILRRTSP